MTSAPACLGCEHPLPEPFLDLGMQPLANALIAPAEVDRVERSYRLAVALCPGCGLVQLAYRVPPELLFAEYSYYSSYSESFLEHARAMSSLLADRFRLDSRSRVLEIASNDGYLLQYFQARGIPVLGIEPARNVARAAEARGIPTLTRFFGPDAVPEVLRRFGPADLIVGNNVLAHVPQINGFLRAVRDCLSPTGAAVFEFPHVRELLERTEFDTIYHEHVFYYSLSAVRTLARRAGFDLIDAESLPVHGGSLRVYLGSGSAAPRVETLLAREEEEGLLSPHRYCAFSRSVQSLRESIRADLEERKRAGHRLAAYGAPAKGAILLNSCGIGRELLDFTVDRSPHKQGRLMPGSRIPIRAPEALLEERPAYTLILPWNLTEEIVLQQREYVRRGGRFLVPIPHPREIAA